MSNALPHFCVHDENERMGHFLRGHINSQCNLKEGKTDLDLGLVCSLQLTLLDLKKLSFGLLQ